MKDTIRYRISSYAITPDAAFLGYSVQELLAFYIENGREGREAYLFIAKLDIFLVIPVYLFLLSAQMLSARVPYPWMYLPTATAALDLSETLIHYYACRFYPEIPSSSVLEYASAATIAKYVGLLLSIVGPFVYGIVRKINEIEAQEMARLRSKYSDDEVNNDKKSESKGKTKGNTKGKASWKSVGKRKWQ